MTIGKKEIRLLIILGLIVYGYLFYQFVLTKSFPEISEVEKKITTAKEEKARLDADIENKEIKKIDLNAKTVAYEKMDGYLAENADVTDTVEYVEKLEKLIGKNLKNIVISLPKEVPVVGADNTPTDKKYYEFSCNFSANMSYNEALDLLSFVEGSTKRVKVSNFTLVPTKEVDNKGQNNSTPTKTPANQTSVQSEQKYDVVLTINLYSLGIKNNDFATSRLSKYVENGWVIADAGQVPVGQTASGTSQTSVTSQTSTTGATEVDLGIYESSVMTAGDNLNIYGVHPNKESITLKTAGKIDVKLKIDKNSYTVETTRVTTGKSNIMRCTLPQKNEINVKVSVELTDITENKDIAINLIVTNNSNKKVNVLLSDNQGRVKVIDRSSAEIKNKSDKEKLQIL